MVPKYSFIAREKLCVSLICEYSLVFGKDDKNNILIKLQAKTRDNDHMLAGNLTFGPDILMDILQGIDKISDQIRAQFQEPEIAARVMSGPLKNKPAFKNWLAGTDSIVEFACKLNASQVGLDQMPQFSGNEQIAPATAVNVASAAPVKERRNKKKKVANAEDAV